LKNGIFCVVAAATLLAGPDSGQLCAEEGPGILRAWCFGIDRYTEMPELRNAENDADLVHALLSRHGFISEVVPDAGVATLKAKVASLGAAKADVRVLFFAGHGVEIEGENYLLPVDFPDVDAPGPALMQEHSLPLREVFEAVRDLEGIKLIILDCCRDNPFGGSGGGLAPVKTSELPDKTLLIFSGAPGTVVSDGEGNNSPFTARFCAKAAPGLPMLDLAALVQEELGEQRPWVAFNGAASSLKSLMETPLLPGRRISASEAKGIQTVRFGEKATVRGFLARLKTYDREGRAVFPFFLTTEHKLIVEPAVDFDPGATGELLEGLEVKIKGMSEDTMEALNGKKVEIRNAAISTGIDLHCHPMAFFADSPKSIQVLPESE
jgi:hypothetical protein